MTVGVIGARVPRSDAIDKVVGRAVFGADLRPPRALHGAFVRSPYAHARVIALGTESALAAPGVVAVLTHKTIVNLLGRSPRFDPSGSAIELTANDVGPTGQMRLFDPVVRFVGQPVALVVAESNRHARAASELVDVEYERLRSVIGIDDALAADAPQLHEDAPGNVFRTFRLIDGDVDAGLDTSCVTIRRVFRTSKQKQAQLEPTNCLAEPGPGGTLAIYAPNHSPHRAKATLSRLLGIPESAIRFVVPTVGGSFGKGDALTVEPYAAVAAMITQRPVRIELSRMEDFVGTELRNPATIDIEGGFAADGTLKAVRALVAVDAGAYLSHSGMVASVLSRQLVATYRVPAFDIRVQVVATNTPVSGAFRGYGGPQAAFAIEHLIDLGARATDEDPLAVRLKMCVGPGDPYGYRNEPVPSAGMTECLVRGAEAIGWHEGREHPPSRFRRGIGIGSVIWKSGIVGNGLDRSEANVRLNSDGSVTLQTGAVDLGTGIRTTLTQICSATLGVPLDSIRLTDTDTSATPFDSGAFASRSLFRNGAAVQAAALKLRSSISVVAARLLEINADDIEVVDGHVQPKGTPSRGMNLAEVARHALLDDGEMVGIGRAPEVTVPSFAAAFAEVEVDTEMGVVVVRRIVLVQDTGTAINPTIVEGQLEGAVSQGLGFALSEGLVVDQETGTVLNATFMDYKIPTAMESPMIETILVTSTDDRGPFGAKGIAEPGIIVTAPAVANAILDAVGYCPTDLPMTPERILDAISTGLADDAVGQSLGLS